MKRISAFLCSVMLFLASAMTVLPIAHAAGTNLVANPSAETNTSNKPASWSSDKWGTNTTSFSYLATGHTGSHSLDTKTTVYKSGDAKWYFAPVTATPNTSYTFTDWYKTSVVSSVDVVITTTSGTDSYIYQGDQAVTTDWKQTSYTFKTPANAAKITVYHYIQGVGELVTDDYSLVNNATVTPTPPVTPTAPTVSLTAPAANATVSSTTNLTASASDNVAVSAVQFKVDGVNVGTADTTSPYSASWDTTTVANGTHSVTAVATNSSNLSTTSSPVNVTVTNTVVPVQPTAPTVSISAPVANATVAGTTTLAANASDAKAVTSVQFKIDGVNVGTADTTSPYSLSWDSKTVANGTHSITAVATNNSALTTTSSAVSFTVNNVVAPTAPTVSITAPAASSNVTGATTLTADAADAKAVTSVQFKVDGANIGAADTTSPYSVSWDSKTVANGTHTVTAVATNSNALTTTSPAISFSVNNVAVPTATNLIANPSMETAQDATTPASWLYSAWGTNTSTASYLTTGHTGSRSVEVQTTSYTNGAANWYYNDVPVTAGKTYQYTNWYKANVDSEVDAEVTMSDGTVQYFYVGTVFANTNWTQFKTTFTVPAGAKSMAMYQILTKVGYIISDDYALNEYTPQAYNRGLVTVTFDDGWANQYKNANPVLKALGIKATYYIISGELNDTPDYMTSAQVKDLYTNGNEIGSHSVTHPDMTTLTAAKLKAEMANSQTTLQNLIGAPVTNFAYPYGAYNATTIASGKQYYTSQRTVNGGYNSKDNLDVTQLKMYEVDSNISQAQVQAWIDGAIAQHVWLILCYHEVATTPSAADDALYTTQPSDFTAEMNYLKNSGASTQTIKQALAEVQAQQ